MLVTKILGMLFLGISFVAAPLTAQSLAKKFHGVWKVTQVVEDGVNQPLPLNPEEGVGNGETDMMEIIIQDSRLVLVQCSGEGMTAALKVTGAMRGPENRSLQRISIQGLGWQGKRDGPHSAILDVNGDQLKLAFHEANTKPDRISEKTGDQQYVLTAVRFNEHDLDSLLESLSNFHESNFSPVFSSSNGNEGHSILEQIAGDERVRKIYTQLMTLPEKQSTSIVAKSYEKSLSELKELALNGVTKQKDVDRQSEGNGLTIRGNHFVSIRYAVHAKLWLIHQFDSLDNFNRRFSDWNDWYVKSLANNKFLDVNSDLPDSNRKLAFSRASPEHMLYLNIVLSELERVGELNDRSRFALQLEEAGMQYPLSKSLNKLRVMPLGAESFVRADRDTEPLVEFIVFSNYCGLHNLNVKSGQHLIREAGHLIDRNWLLNPSLEIK